MKKQTDREVKIHIISGKARHINADRQILGHARLADRQPNNNTNWLLKRMTGLFKDRQGC
jgi:hypothetical protein